MSRFDFVLSADACTRKRTSPRSPATYRPRPPPPRAPPRLPKEERPPPNEDRPPIERIELPRDSPEDPREEKLRDEERDGLEKLRVEREGLEKLRVEREGLEKLRVEREGLDNLGVDIEPLDVRLPDDQLREDLDGEMERGTENDGENSRATGGRLDVGPPMRGVLLELRPDEGDCCRNTGEPRCGSSTDRDGRAGSNGNRGCAGRLL